MTTNTLTSPISAKTQIYNKSPVRVCGKSDLDRSLLQGNLENSVSEEDNGGVMSRLLAVVLMMASLSGSTWAQDATSKPAATATNSGSASAVTETTETGGTPTAKDATYLICKNRAVVRTLRVSQQGKGGGCVATYTKDGVDQIVGHSWAIERCAKVIGNIRENLEKAKWKCKDISEARVSSSEGE
jgi:hypothetical protein